MHELSLFTGGGGGVLGTHLLGWRPVGYVEIDDYAQRILRARIDDGMLPDAPIFGDVRAFISEGYAAAYQGLVDVVTAGFPCQPFSVAGSRLGADDGRNMWPETIATIRLVRPRYCLLENVPGLLASGYFGTILGDLAESGYDARWRVLSAAEVGAPHRRDRVWIVAVDDSSRRNRRQNVEGQQAPRRVRAGESGEDVDNPIGDRWHEGGTDNGEHDRHISRSTGQHAEDVADANGKHGRAKTARHIAGMGRKLDQPHAGRPAERRAWWATEPDVGRVDHGLAARVDRLKALGNGQVPAVVRAAWELLTALE